MYINQSTKTKKTVINISLLENDVVTNDQTAVANVLNDYYVNVSKTIG